MIRTRLFPACFLLVVWLSACNQSGSPVSSLSPATPTGAEETTTKPPLNTIQPTSTTPRPQKTGTVKIISSLSSGTPTLIPARTQTFTPTTICNRVLPGSPLDITIPDYTTLSPGQTFSKTWRFQNAGSCTWTSQYQVIFFSGDPFGASQTNPLGDAVAPGESIDFTLDMVAPNNPGTYQSNWELSDAQGNTFGLGPGGNTPFWVRIIVVPPNSPTPTLIPSQTQTPTPEVIISGLVNLKPNDSLDLDTDQANPTSEEDILYTLESNNTHRLTPKNGAKIGIYGSAVPSNPDCVSASLASTPITLDTIDQGTYFCFLTNLAHPGWARLVALNAKDYTLTLEVLTWAAH